MITVNRHGHGYAGAGAINKPYTALQPVRVKGNGSAKSRRQRAPRIQPLPGRPSTDFADKPPKKRIRPAWADYYMPDKMVSLSETAVGTAQTQALRPAELGLPGGQFQGRLPARIGAALQSPSVIQLLRQNVQAAQAAAAAPAGAGLAAGGGGVVQPLPAAQPAVLLPPRTTQRPRPAPSTQLGTSTQPPAMPQQQVPPRQSTPSASRSTSSASLSQLPPPKTTSILPERTSPTAQEVSLTPFMEQVGAKKSTLESDLKADFPELSADQISVIRMGANRLRLLDSQGYNSKTPEYGTVVNEIVDTTKGTLSTAKRQQLQTRLSALTVKGTGKERPRQTSPTPGVPPGAPAGAPPGTISLPKKVPKRTMPPETSPAQTRSKTSGSK